MRSCLFLVSENYPLIGSVKAFARFFLTVLGIFDIMKGNKRMIKIPCYEGFF